MIQSRSDDRQDQIPEPEPTNRRPGRIAAVVCLSFVAVIGLLAVVFPAQFRHQVAISVVRQSDPYTQLFFSDPAALPVKLKIDHANKFSFTVTNDQGHTGTYHYTVTLSHGDANKVVSTGSMTVGSSQSATRAAEVEPTAHHSRYLVKVALSGTADVIQFYSETS